MSLGKISLWTEHIKSSGDRNAIARVYGMDEVIFCPFLHAITVIRNKCAHHCRVWNRSFPKHPRLPKAPAALNSSFNFDPKMLRKIYNPMCILLHLMNIINPGHTWRKRFGQLLQKYPGTSVRSMGFPEGWEKLPLWIGVFDQE